MIAWPALLIVAAAGYVIGSIPTGFLIGRKFGVDPRADRAVVSPTVHTLTVRRPTDMPLPLAGVLSVHANQRLATLRVRCAISQPN